MTRSRLFTRALAFLLLSLAVSAPPAFGQDVNAMAKWTAFTVVHYKVVGEFSGETRLLSFQVTFPVNDETTVTDRVEFEFDWDQNETKLVGKPVVRNFPSKAAPLTPMEGCPGTKLEGAFEFATVIAVKDVLYQGIALVTRRDYAAGAVPHPARESGTAPCGHRWDRIAPKSETIDMGVGVPVAMALAMPGVFPISKDGKSLIVTKAGWTFTFTPTGVR